ncbi:hypothetical protein [Clostridium brassicae]|uniref:Uncharacterized protein n=1 Tax=Clostridium brassicae TaxID=2999072 RepID=A0ABT4D9S6_9CLOT|nr:hypothetical protein [Clostridium brassicae]MCY6959065.1 hypothetical protein [Clostridium brassicae]
MKRCRIMNNHHFNCLNKHEKMFLASIIGCSFMRGILVGMYLNNK